MWHPCGIEVASRWHRGGILVAKRAEIWAIRAKYIPLQRYSTLRVLNADAKPVCSPRDQGLALATHQAFPPGPPFLNFDDMAKATSSHFKPALPGAEEHNERTKQLDYVRKDLSHLNQTWKADGFTTVEQSRKEVAEKYKAAHGKKLPKNATPIQETVVVIKSDTTMEQLQLLAKRIEETWGFKPLAIYTHMDEGHKSKTETREWKPNLHAHIVFDTTDSKGESLKPISEKMRKSAKLNWEKKEAALAQKENREPRQFIPPKSWSLPAFDHMQDLTAECLEMERGVSSSVKHKDALEYKVSVLTEQAEAEAEKLHQLQEQNRLEKEDLVQRCEGLREEGRYTVKVFDYLDNLDIVKPTAKQKEFRDKMEKEYSKAIPTDSDGLNKHALDLRYYLANLTTAINKIGKKLKDIAKAVPLFPFKKGRMAREAQFRAAEEAANQKAANSMSEAENARKSAEKAVAEAKEQAKAAIDNAKKREEEADKRERKAQRTIDTVEQQKTQSFKEGYNSGLNTAAQQLEVNKKLRAELEKTEDKVDKMEQRFFSLARKLNEEFDAKDVMKFEGEDIAEIIGIKAWQEAKEKYHPEMSDVLGYAEQIRNGWHR